MKKIFIKIWLFIICIGIPSSSLASSYVMHTVKEGDSLYSISKDYNISYNNLISLNGNEEIYEGNLIKLRPIDDNKTIQIYLNDNYIYSEVEPYMENGRTFVPIRFISESIGIDEIYWDSNKEEAILIKDGTSIVLPINKSYALVNNISIELDAPINIYNGRTFIPIRFVSEAFDIDVYWDEDNTAVNLYTKDYIKTKSQDTVISPAYSNFYSEEDLYWLSRLVQAEAGGEPFEGKLAVANCVINRKESDDFPNTIKEVIFDTNWGVQYTPVANGAIYNNPSEESIKAAKMALEGNNNIGECLYFLNPKKSTSYWIIQNRTFYKTINNHDFYL
ncbi:stalk domain-containing protein [Defluviitalea phaphyphila]|uniref:stalk domain-containing protein n=1 Tax=Defluviitalea phaphyphila TaxID=1473580 RepID=UPI0007317813|nr:stalk domain-containing protein [Defluviitalea phaphyphila]